MSTKKILVTGGNGFIATNYIKLLAKKYPDMEIHNIDCLDFPITTNNHDELDTERYRFHNKSILDYDFLKNLFAQEKFDQVINFAAKSHVDTSITNPGIFVETNVLGTHNLLDLSLKNEVGLFFHISTDEVYGSLTMDDPSTKEDSPLEPNNPYSAAKAGADCMVRSYSKTFKLPIVLTRSSNNFGAYQYPEKLIPVIISNALSNESIPVYGDGSNVRDWIHVEENCNAIDLVRTKGKTGEIYNIPGYREIKNIDIVKTILSSLNKPESLIKFVEDRKGHDIRYSMDGTKIQNLGFSFESDFETSLKKTIDWYLKNESWLQVKAPA
jgi:dTDP-glucose 4,6-dehydratase